MIRDNQWDFLTSLQKQILKDYTAFWNSIPTGLNLNMSGLAEMNKAMANMQKLSKAAEFALIPPLPMIMSQMNTQIELLSSELSASASLASVLSDFSASMKSSIDCLPDLAPSVLDSIENISKSVGCSAYFLDIVEKHRNWDIKLTAPANFSARLLSIGQTHAHFVNKTLGFLPDESFSHMKDNLLRSLGVADGQLLTSAHTLSALIPSVESITQTPPPCTLNLLEVQQNEILDMEPDEDTLAPSTELSFEISANIGILLKCKEIALPVDGKALIRLTDKNVVAINELPWVVVVDKTTLGEFVDNLFFLFYEGAGSEKLRFVSEYGGVLDRNDCAFIWRFKHMRNIWFRHDYQHGKPADIERKKKALQDDLTYYGLSRKPRSTEEFRLLQVNMVKDMSTFVSTLEAAILKS